MALAWQPPRYPLATPALGCLRSPCGSFQIVDLLLQGELGDQARQRAGLRFKIGRAAIVGLETGPEVRALSLRTARLDFRYLEAGERSLELIFRAPRLRIDLGALRRPTEDGAGWTLGATASASLTPELEVQLTGLRDLRRQAEPFLPPSPEGLGRLGLLWQRGSRTELRVGVTSAGVRDGAGLEFPRWGTDASAVLVRGRAEVTLAARYEQDRGRRRRRRLDLSAEARMVLTSRLLALAGVEQGLELGLVDRRRRLRAGLTLHGRAVHLERSAASASAALGLIDRALDQGFEERAAFGDRGLRDLRERMSLTSPTGDLDRWIDEVYRTTVDSRNLPQLGFEVGEERRRDVGSRVRSFNLLVGVPWPLAWPWHSSEDAVEFLRLEWSHVDAEYTTEARERGDLVALAFHANRDLTARLAWEQPVRTPLEIAFGRESLRRVLLRVEYSFQR